MSGDLAALISAVLWAVSSVLLALGARRLRVVPLNMVRCLVSTSFFWALLPFYGGWRALEAVPPSAWVWLVVSVLGLLVIGDTLYFRSMNLAGVSWAMPIASITPIWTVLLASFLVQEPLTWSLFAGAVLVVVGIALLSRSSRQMNPGNPADGKARRVGLLMALGVSVLWAIGHVALKPATEGVHAVVANCIRQPMGALMLLGLTLVQGRRRDLRKLDRRSWGIIILASFIGTGLGSLFFVTAIQLAGAGRTTVLSATAPVMAIPFSILWLQERPNRWILLGTLLTTAGIILVI